MKFQAISPTVESVFETSNRIEFRKVLASWLGPVQGIRLVLVADSSGKTVGKSGDSQSLSSSEDLELLLAARSLAGAAITSARTAVAEQISASSLCPILVVFGTTDPGMFPARLSKSEGKYPVHLLTSQNRLHSPATIVNAGLALARSSGRSGLLLESGMTLGKSFAQLGLINQIVLSSRDLGSDSQSTPVWLTNRLELDAEALELRSSALLGQTHTVTVWDIRR